MEKRSNNSVCLAVLPFENLTPENELGYFARGFVEDLIIDLARFPTLMVISSHSSQNIAPGHDAERARELGIDYFLKGSFRYRESHVRISVQLIQAPDGGVVWAERYDEPRSAIFEIHDRIIQQVAAALSVNIESSILSASYKKPFTQLEAYDCWLRGNERLRRGTKADDEKAREYFARAIEIDPHYARAYAGMSLTYFNEWSCIFWEKWSENESGAFQNALKASQLDETDHVAQMVLGRIFLYRREFEKGENAINKALSLNPNDADCVVQVALCKTYLGYHEEGLKLYHKAIRLNPYRDSWYYVYGAFPVFNLRDYGRAIDLASRAPLNLMVDLPGYLAAAYAYEGAGEMARRHLEIFMRFFQERITFGRLPEPDEAIDWALKVNPYRRKEDSDHFAQGLVKAGIMQGYKSSRNTRIAPTSGDTVHAFRKEQSFWHITFEGKTVLLPEMKGFHDLAALIRKQGEDLHCSELMGEGYVDSDLGEAVFDQKAKADYRHKLTELQAEIEEADLLQDAYRSEQARRQMESLVDQLSKATGLGGRTRKSGSSIERARAAVTLRIRAAIRKIERAHPSLGRHLSLSVQTGVFCAYRPEKETRWEL